MGINWKVVAASVVGFSHKDNGTPCQDSHAAYATPSGWLMGAVADGAGSASRSQEGSEILVTDLTQYLTGRIREFETSSETAFPAENSLRNWIEQGIDLIRLKLEQRAQSDGGSLRDYDTTLIGVIAGRDGGVFFHIGDGAAFAASLQDLSTYVISKPENGEYANETFFVTQAHWREHLRLTAFDAHFDLVLLMSDGVTPFALASGCSAPFAPFVEPLSTFLVEHNSVEGRHAVAAMLDSERLRRITADDKTLLWALRSGGAGNG